MGNPNIGDNVALLAMGYDSTEYYNNTDVVTTNGGKVYMWLPQNTNAAAKIDVIVPGSIMYTKIWARTGTAETQILLRTGNAIAPNITTQPIGGTYVKNSVQLLSVAAGITDEGVLSYQWYSNTSSTTAGGSAISGATGASYTPDTGTVGKRYYYCVITNTNNGVTGIQTATATSTVVEVTVVDKPLVGSISVSEVNVGDILSLTAPSITDNGAAVSAQGWEISLDGSTCTAFVPNTPMTYPHNGQYLRYYVTNSVGTSYSNTIQLTVNKFDLTLSLTCADITYGGILNPQLTGNTGGGTVTYEYKIQGEADSTYVTTKPTAADDYTIRATVAATDIYND